MTIRIIFRFNAKSYWEFHLQLGIPYGSSGKLVFPKLYESTLIKFLHLKRYGAIFLRILRFLGTKQLALLENLFPPIGLQFFKGQASLIFSPVVKCYLLRIRFLCTLISRLRSIEENCFSNT